MDTSALHVAITGTEGAGKSVFITTFAKHIQNSAAGWGLDPLSVLTQQYVEAHWDLLRHGEWPPATQPGTFAELDWTLTLPPDLERIRKTVSLSVVDPAGHDFRNLYTNDYHWYGELPESVAALAGTLSSAHILFVLVNLKDFLGESDATRRLNSELALKFALDAAKSNGVCRYVAILITQADQFPQLVQGDDWRRTLREVVPIFATAHLDARCEVFPITAVDRVRILTGADGHSRKVPEADFQSQGYDQVLAWLQRIVPSIQDELKFEKVIASVKNGGAVLLDFVKKNWSGAVGFVFCLILTCVVFNYVVRGINWYRLPPQPKFGTPNLVHVTRKDGSIFVDTYYDYRVWVDVENQGGPGMVTFRLYLNEDSEPALIQEPFLRRETKRIERNWKDLRPNDAAIPAKPYVELIK